ncbi:g6467 [Coccomyxa elongata]
MGHQVGDAESPYSVLAIVRAAQLGELDALTAAAEDSWILSRLFQQLLAFVHNSTETPWWLTIMYTTIGARLLTLPLIVKQQRNTANMTMARPEMMKLKDWYTEETARGNPKATMEYQQRLANLWQKYDCNPFKSMLGLFAQAPLFIGFFSALRSLSAAKVPSMTEGGMSWFTDLTLADPYYALPIMSSAVFLLTVELGAADGMQGQDEALLRRMKNIFRAMGVAMVPLTASFPQGVFIYWVTSNVFSLGQAMLFKIPAVRTALKLPDMAKLRATATGLPITELGKPVVTYAQPPKLRKVKSS